MKDIVKAVTEWSLIAMALGLIVWFGIIALINVEEERIYIGNLCSSNDVDIYHLLGRGLVTNDIFCINVVNETSWVAY